MTTNAIATNLKIERIEKPTKEFFKQYIATARRPFIITGIVNEWKAYSLWTADYLNNVVGDKEIGISVSKTQSLTGSYKEQMKFRDYIDLLRLDSESKDKLY